MNVIKYKTVSAENTQGLDTKVNALLNQGWQLAGPPYVMGTTPCQPMIVLEEGPPTNKK